MHNKFTLNRSHFKQKKKSSKDHFIGMLDTYISDANIPEPVKQIIDISLEI